MITDIKGLRICIAAAFVCATLAPASATVSETRERTATAYQLGGDRVLYTEIHRERVENGRLVEAQVTYLDPARQVIAEKVVDFRVSTLAPNFSLEDRRTGYQESLGGRPPERVVQVREVGSDRARSATLIAGDDLVADAGFDRFIETYWETLLAGEVLVRRFVIPSQLDALAFRIRHTGTVDGSEEFALEIDSALLRLVVPAIRARYAADTRKLVRYEGLSNIRDTDGDNLEVRIEFTTLRQARGLH